MIPISGPVGEKLRRVSLLLLDVDGVLTDGRIIYDDAGVETKRFHVQDGFGLRLLQDAGIAVGIVTGRSGAALHHRCRDLGIDLVLEGVSDKAAALEAIRDRQGHPLEEMAFAGDDWPDLPAMARAGVALAVPDAAPEVRERADGVTDRPGGRGAVREMCEAILRAGNRWDAALNRFLPADETATPVQDSRQ